MKNRKLFGIVVVLAAVIVFGGSASAAGKKYGLFVGINEYVTSNPLFGCVNDAIAMRQMLQAKYGFVPANTKLLVDAAATRAAILSNLKKYQGLAGKGDIFVFHYSGHGTLFPDKYSEDRDETKLIYMEGENEETGEMEVIYPRDRYDSAIVPIDSDDDTSGKPWGNLIIDDELSAIFAGFTQKGAQVVFISDSCHSGTVGKAAKSKWQGRSTPLAAALGKKRFSDIRFKEPSNARTTGYPVPVNGLYIVLTGSKDNEFSLDAGDLPKPMGLFTSTFLKQLNKPGGTRLTYQQTMAIVSPAVSKESKVKDNDQNPQLDARYGNASSPLFSLPR